MASHSKPYTRLWADLFRSRLVVALWVGFLLIHLLFVVLAHAAPKVLQSITVEDGVLEYLSAVMFLAGSLLFLAACWRAGDLRRRFWAGAFAFAFFAMAGEEVSWGQRIFRYHVATVEDVNRQGEFNVHNLEFLHDSSWNTGRLLTIGSLAFGVLLPLLLSTSRVAQRILIQVCCFPVPHPVVGVCFLLSWLWYRSGYNRFPLEIAVEESREATIALGFFVYAVLVWMSKWHGEDSPSTCDIPE